MSHVEILCIVIVVLSVLSVGLIAIWMAICNDIREHHSLMRYSKWRLKKVTSTDNKVLYYPQVNYLGLWFYFESGCDIKLSRDSAECFENEYEATEFIQEKKDIINKIYRSKEKIEYIDL